MQCFHISLRWPTDEEFMDKMIKSADDYRRCGFASKNKSQLRSNCHNTVTSLDVGKYLPWPIFINIKFFVFVHVNN